MGVNSLVGDLLEVIVDDETGCIVQLVNRVSGRRQLLAREPELALREPAMGIVELEPFFPKDWRLKRENGKLVAAARRAPLHLTRVLEAEGAGVRYELRVRNEGESPERIRLRVAAYLAPARGGFWGEAEGATYSCRYFASFGYAGKMETFSTTFVPEGARGFAFEKHSYKSRFMPELKWFAALDAELREGVGIICLTPGCYGVVEDQFFNLELNLVKPEHVLEPGQEASLAFEIYPIMGFTRIDHLSPSFAAAIESPSATLPGEKYRGTIKVFPFVDLPSECKAWIELARGMASIGKRGYCVDRVPSGARSLRLRVSSPASFTKYSVTEIPFETEEPLSWSMDAELYEVPYVKVMVGGEVVKRAFSINPDLKYVIELLPENTKRKAAKLLEFNPPIESEFMEREAAIPLLNLLVRAATIRPAKLMKEQLKLERLRDFADLLAAWGRPAARKLLSEKLDSRTVGSAPVLTLALSYLATREEEYLESIKRLLEYMVESVERGTFIDWFNALQGGGGASRFADYAIAIDLLESELGSELVENALWSLSWVREELLKLTNAWAGNWEISEAAALLALSLKLGDAGGPAFVKGYATLLAALDAFLPDGAWPELSAGYHVYALDSLLRALEILKLSGKADLYQYKGRCGKPVVESALEWLWELATPYNVLPALEDSGEFTLPLDPYVVVGIRLGSPRLLSIASKLLREGARIASPYTILTLAASDVRLGDILAQPPPQPRNRVSVLRESGRFVYRSSEDPDALYVVLDFGPQGGWHGHYDRLSFEVHRNGEAVVVDAGSAGYYSRLHWEWNRRSIAHNTVTLGTSDHPELSRCELVELREEGGGVVAVFRAPIAEGATLERRLSVEGSAVEVADTIWGRGVFRWNLHLRGRLARLEGRVVEVVTGRNRLLVELPKQPVVARGFRGSGEETLYIYYEVPVDGRGEAGARMVFA